MLKLKLFRMTLALVALFLLSCAHDHETRKPELISGDLKIKSLLYLPRPLVAGKKYPGIVLNHGGWKGAEFPLKAWGKELASKGFIVIVPQFRGQGGSEGNFEFAHGEVDDSLAALRYLKSLSYVDTGRIGMVGYSLGGLITLRAAERVQGLKAVVVISALSDPVKFFQGKLREIKELSPFTEIGKIDAPVLVMHGEMDGRVSVEQSRFLYERLKAAGKEVELKLYPYANHGILWDDAPRDYALKFLEKRLS